MLRGRVAGSYQTHEYRTVKERMLAKPVPPYVRFPCVTPGWDNSARRRAGALILKNATPELYRDWVTKAMNADLPFDQFTLWQIAGDLLPESERAKLPERRRGLCDL